VERRPVRLGQAPDGLAVVLSGLEENERVVVRGAFFLDAERRLHSSSPVPGR
jgi:multidrug efflux pump subunit AcrA (membrane-fusion protein)